MAFDPAPVVVRGIVEPLHAWMWMQNSILRIVAVVETDLNAKMTADMHYSLHLPSVY